MGKFTEPTESKTLVLDKASARRAQAILAHLRLVISTVSNDEGWFRPLSIEHEELLLASASLRALFFDGGGMLTLFLEEQNADLMIEAFETDLGLILLSELIDDEFHISDFIMDAYFRPSTDERKAVDKPWPLLVAYDDREKFGGLLRRAHLWAPKRDTGINGPSPSSNVGPMQLATFCRKRTGLKEWGRLRLGYLKGVPIDRRSIVTYVANQLGGVHYDSKRLPKDPDDANQFQALAQGLDWDHEAITPGGLVAIALACVEIARSPDVMKLAVALDKFVRERQERLKTKAVI